MIGVKHAQMGQALFIWLEPGDGTRYEFVVMRRPPLYPGESNTDNLMVATVSSITFRGYYYHDYSVQGYLDRATGRSDEDVLFTREVPTGVGETSPALDEFLAYMSDSAHSACNPWTARAACLAMGEFLKQEAL